MTNSNPRSRRVAEQILQELAAILMREMKDPRVAGVTFTAVEVTSDLEHAKVWFTVFGDDHEAARQGLARASGFLRSELAQRMSMRTVPKLNFLYDESVARGAHLSHLIEQAVEEDRRHSHEQSGHPPEQPSDAASGSERHDPDEAQG